VLSDPVSSFKLTPGALSGSGYRSLACANYRSLFRLLARTSGASPLDNGVETNLAIPFNRLPSCRFSRLQGFAIIQSPLPYSLAAEARSPRVLSPFRVLHAYSVGGCYQLPPLMPFSPLLFSFGRDFSGLVHCLRVSVPILRWLWTFTLLGVAALQGFLPLLSFSLLPVIPLWRVQHAAGFALKTGRLLHLLPCGNDRRLLALAMVAQSCD